MQFTAAISFAAMMLTASSSSSGVIAQSGSVTRAPQGFIFDCDTNVCPTGPYQDLCPQCDDLDYLNGANALQCLCFDSNKMLQGGSTIRDAQNCGSISADSTGALVCNSGSGSLRGDKHNHKGGANSASSSAAAIATAAPTPDFIATASPTTGSGPVLVDFVFNCVGGTCPDGQYQQFCPRCVINTDSAALNDPADSISCSCFNYNGEMLLRTSTMWSYEECPKITSDFGGVLTCVGAKKNSPVRVYGPIKQN
jgi:hypothetical protein